jgi:hypothetical protein
MKTTIKYFSNENEALEYGRKNNIEYMENRVENARKEWDEYFKPFAEVDGCDVLFMLSGSWSSVRLCIRWKGVTMTTRNDYNGGDKTQALVLAEPMDWKGLDMNRSDDGQQPQKIGKPTAKKLDEWRNWLLIMRKDEEQRRDRRFAEMLAKIDDVCRQFPEAQAVKWDERGQWTFEKEQNGLLYVCQIQRNGYIYEKCELGFIADKYVMSTAERAARMMQNGMEGVKPCKTCGEAWQQKEKMIDEQVARFMGGRPF